MSEYPTALTDGTHVGIYGVTGAGDHYGGKTATANWWAHSLLEGGWYRFAVAFGRKLGNFEPSTEVRNVEGAAEAFASGETFVSWVPHDRTPSGMEDSHSTAFSFAEGLNGPTVFVHDDAFVYENSPMLSMATAVSGNPGDGSHRIKSLVVSQDPWDLPRKSLRSNLPVIVWVGPMTSEGYSYFRQVKGSEVADALREYHGDGRERPHTWTLIDGDDLYHFEAVPGKWA